VFIAIVIAFGLIVGAFLINRARPPVETSQPSAEFVRASGKCAECHTQQTYSVVHEYEMSRHAARGGVPRIHSSKSRASRRRRVGACSVIAARA
jgi:hypothetical protein